MPANLIRTMVLLTALSLPAPSQEPSSSLTGIHLIRDARVEVSPGEFREETSILIKDGLIAALGSDLEAPPGAAVIEARGLLVTAGFLVLGPEVSAPDQESKAAAAGLSEAASLRIKRGIRAGAEASDLVTSALPDPREWLAAGATTLAVLPPGQPLAGHACLVSTAGGDPSARILAQDVCLRVRLRSAGAGYPRSLMGVMALLRQTFADARTRLERVKLYAGDPGGLPSPGHEPDLDALAPVLSGKEAVLFEVTRPGDARRASLLVKEGNLCGWLGGGRPLARALGGLAWEEPVVALDPSPGKILHPENKALLKGGTAGAGPSTSRPAESLESSAAPQDPLLALRREEAARREREELEQLFTCGRRVLERRGRLLFLARTASDFLAGVRAQVAHGLDPRQALAALTTEPAELLGASRTRGRVAVGLAADLLVWQGEPFADGHLKHVFSRGIRHDIKEAPRDGDKKNETSLTPLAGIWETRDQTFLGTLAITVEGGEASGSLRLPFGEARLVSASLEKRDFEMAFTIDTQEGGMTFTLAGSLSEDGRTLEGSARAEGMPERRFRAVRKEPRR